MPFSEHKIAPAQCIAMTADRPFKNCRLLWFRSRFVADFVVGSMASGQHSAAANIRKIRFGPVSLWRWAFQLPKSLGRVGAGSAPMLPNPRSGTNLLIRSLVPQRRPNSVTGLIRIRLARKADDLGRLR